jgi:hypothetical protein
LKALETHEVRAAQRAPAPFGEAHRPLFFTLVKKQLDFLQH